MIKRESRVLLHDEIRVPKDSNDIDLSIITVCYNSEKTIETTIKSVLLQHFCNMQYIIVDGDSTDNTRKIIETYRPAIEDKMNFVLVSEPDDGIYDAMNKGIRLAGGKLIGIINSDDWYEEGCLNEVWRIFNDYDKDEIVIYGLLRIVKDSTTTILDRNHDELRTKGMICHPTCFVSKKVYERIGVFDTRYNIAADYDFMLRAYEKGVRFVKINKVLADFRVGGTSERNDIRNGMELLTLKYRHGYISKIKYVCKMVIYPVERFIIIVPKRPSTIWRLLIRPMLERRKKDENFV